MMARGENGTETEMSANADLEPYYRLVEMQKQMIDLIRRNAYTERECAALRDQLAREAEALARSRRSLPDRLRKSASQLFQRVLRRNEHNRKNATDPFAITWSRPFGERGGLPESPPPNLNPGNSSCAIS